MVYFIRAKSYFKYAQDLFSSLKDSYQSLSEEEFFKKAREVVFVALKALWALSQVTPPEKPPEFEEVLKASLKSLSEEKAAFIKNLCSQLDSRTEKARLVSSVEQLLNLIKDELKPIL
jgi:Fe2+ transport system protein B